MTKRTRRKASPGSEGRRKRHPMELLPHAMAKKQMVLAGLKPAAETGRDIVLLVKTMRPNFHEITWPTFFRVLDEKKLGVFIDPMTGFMKIMGVRNQKVPETD